MRKRISLRTKFWKDRMCVRLGGSPNQLSNKTRAQKTDQSVRKRFSGDGERKCSQEIGNT